MAAYLIIFSMATKFGLITEGPTDQVIIKNVLARFISPDIATLPVQPNTDSTDKADHFGGWGRVLGYCKSADMLAVIEVNDFVIIQMDTDVCEEYGVQKRVAGNDLTSDEIVQKTKELIIENIGRELYAAYKHKIIFAISHESIECWLMPLYYNDNRRTKTTNCCETLNQELTKKGFTLDCDNKNPYYYKKICKEIKNKAQIENIAVHNNSFNQFIQQLPKI